GTAGAGRGADDTGHLADPGGLDAGARRLLLPRVQPAHAAQPDGPRGDARTPAPAPALAARAGLDAGTRRVVVGFVRRGLGRLRRGTHGPPRVSRRRRPP